MTAAMRPLSMNVYLETAKRSWVSTSLKGKHETHEGRPRRTQACLMWQCHLLVSCSAEDVTAPAGWCPCP